MMKHLVIGITGGIATGKSSVLRELARRGIPTVSSDSLAHACLLRGHPCYRRVVAHFGRDILKSDRQIDRRRLGAIVFSKSKERKWLEKQIHPHVVRGLRLFIRKHPGMSALDIPLLFEARLEKLVDRVVVVWSSKTAQLARMQRRDKLPKAAALQRMRAQMPLSTKKKRADFVLANRGSLKDLGRQVGRLLDQLRRLA
jgi:dephospho-CoA kinase